MAKEFISDIVERKNLAYVSHGGPRRTLDLYGPKKARNVPLIVWIHAGGNLAALVGTAGEIRDFEVGENLGYSSRVQAVCDFFGPTDFLQMDAHRFPDGQIHDAPDSPESKLVGGPIQDNPDKVRRVNPGF